MKPEPLPEISALFDLSLDIERHESDRLFHADGGKIIYVFDENIFELFVFPKQFRRYCRIFFSGEAVPFDRERGPSGTSPGALRTLAMQSALVTAEYLFSGALPGQIAPGNIFLTPWHREELLDRLGELITDIGGDGGDIIKAGTPTVQRKLDYWRQEQNQQRSDWRKESYRDRMTVTDLTPLSQLSPESLSTFARSREMALLLGEEEKYEPVQQLQRIIAPPFQERLKGLVSLARPEAKDESRIRARAEEWWDLLQDEMEHREGLSVVNRPRRKESTAWRDCQSLAMLEWYSTTLDEDAGRVVFVTGDVTLFDAYRRQYTQMARRPVFRQTGFLLRRPVQYTPLFNPGLISTGHIEPHHLFFNARSIIHTALAPLQLASIHADLKQAVEYKNRESLTLRPLKSKDRRVPPPLELSWRAQIVAGNPKAAKWIDELKDRWSSGERIRIGWAGDAIRKRLSESEKVLFKTVTSTPSEHEGEIIERYLENRARDLAKDTLDIWRPIARRSFNQWLATPSGADERAPVAVFLPVNYDGVAVDLLGMLYASKAGKTKALDQSSEAVDFLSNQFELFVASAVLALMRHEWRLAQHFSDMATKTFEYSSRSDRPTEVRAAEAYYCLALALRFRIGELAFVSPGHARRLFDRAELALDRCYKTSLDRQATSKQPHFNSLRNFRVKAEAAALHGFKVLQELLSDTPSLDDARKTVKQIQTTLSACSELRNRGLADIVRTDSPNDACRVLARQFLVNRAAVYLVRLALGESKDELRGEEMCRSTLSEIATTKGAFGPGYSPILSLELSAFESLFSDDGGRRLAEVLVRTNENELEIDTRWRERLSAMMSAD